MCSKPGLPPADPSPPGLSQLSQAIEELAAEAAGVPDAGTQDVTQRLARVWDMLADLDPELARRLAGYGD